MIKNLNLKNYNYVFNSSNISLKIKNIIYGKNGSGKSTLVKAIKNEYGSDYNLMIFQGYEKFIGNDDLDSIVLGEKNNEIQKEIDSVEKEIKIRTNSLSDINNNYYLPAKNNYSKAHKALRKLKANIAKEIKNEHVNLVGPNFNINKLEEYIPYAEEIDYKKINEYENILTSTVKEPKVKHLRIPLLAYLNTFSDSVNEILQTKVTPKTIIKELVDNPQKQNFAREGMKIHKRNEGEICSFCGNTISLKRWDDLDKVFSKDVDNLNKRINSGIQKINYEMSNLENIGHINKKDFNKHFFEKVDILNAQLDNYKGKISKYLNDLLDDLNNKIKSPFETLKISDENLSFDFDLENNYKRLLKENDLFNKSIKSNKSKAKLKLIRHYVNNKISKKTYIDLNNSEKETSASFNIYINKLESEKNKLKKLKSILYEKKIKMTSELKAAKSINELLNMAGNSNFYLKLSSSDESKYVIVDKDGSLRSFNTLSTGEKNALAFFYFYYSLKSVSNFGKENIIIIDDPINSNDSNYEYLIMSCIKEIINNFSDTQKIIMTHNNFFIFNLKVIINIKKVIIIILIKIVKIIKQILN